MRMLPQLGFVAALVLPAGPVFAILIHFETSAGYGPTDGANLMSPAQPATGTRWSSNLPEHPAYTWRATGGTDGTAGVRIDGNIATNHHAANFRPSGADWGLSAMLPADRQVWFGIRVRLHRNDGSSGRAPANITFMRDSDGANRGRGLRFAVQQNGDVAVLNVPNRTFARVFTDTSAFVPILGMLDYNAKTGTVWFGRSAVHGFSFINEGGTGMDEYGFLNIGSGTSIHNTGFDVSFDDIWFGTTPPPPSGTLVLIR